MQIAFKLLAVADELVQEGVIGLSLFKQQLCQRSRQVGFAAGTILEEALGLFFQLDLALVGYDQAGIVLACCQLYLLV